MTKIFVFESVQSWNAVRVHFNNTGKIDEEIILITTDTKKKALNAAKKHNRNRPAGSSELEIVEADYRNGQYNAAYSLTR